tara:strand:+ start:88 stop:540 length:453 start_codon:yes stop_codon:yes gene_type:complete
MRLNRLSKTFKKKIRPARGIGSGKGKTAGRGHKGQKSRSGVAIKSFEGGQMPLFRRLPKRGFKAIKKNNTAILNLSKLQNFHDQKKINLENNLDLKTLQSKKIVSKKFQKLKILGKGEIKSKINLSVNFVSKQAKEKIEKIGGKLTLIKN